MAKQKSPQLPPQLVAYNLVMETAKAVYMQSHDTGHGWKSWFAEQLGVSRQVLDSWGRRDAIPNDPDKDYIGHIAEITGLNRDDITVLTIKVSLNDWRYLRKKEPETTARMDVISIDK